MFAPQGENSGQDGSKKHDAFLSVRKNKCSSFMGRSLPGGGFHYSIPAVLNVCTKLQQDVFSSAALLCFSHHRFNFSAELLPQQYFMAVSPQVNARESEQLQVLLCMLVCLLDCYPDLCKELHVTVYYIQSHCFFLVGLSFGPRRMTKGS